MYKYIYMTHRWRLNSSSQLAPTLAALAFAPARDVRLGLLPFLKLCFNAVWTG